MTQKHKSVFERFTDNKKESRHLAEGSLAKLNELGLNANPIHFTLMFEWLSEKDPFLHAEIEQALQDNSYSNITAENLFINLIGQMLYNSIPSEEVDNVLKSLQANLNSWLISGNQQREILQKHITEMTQLALPKELKEPLLKVILPTVDAMVNQTETLKDQVNQANQEIHHLKKELERASSVSKIDELTNIANRNGFNETLNKTVQQANSDQSSFAMILIDLDHFTDINDSFGYLIGDSVLRYTAKLVGNEVGVNGSYARFDGQQFIILLPNSYYYDAMQTAESIRTKISARPLQIKSNQKTLKLSISAGVSLYQMGENIDNLFDRITTQLVAAKSQGRNRICGDG